MVFSAYETIEKLKMLNGIKAVIVGISGGADSVALLHLLCSIRCDNGIEVRGAHINHCLRGNEALRDEEFVINLCREMGVEASVYRADIQNIAKERGIGLEECGRQVRYEYFERLISGSSERIVTAHTLSDSVETVLLNLVRGTGITGLCGIPPIRNNIIRPLIYTKRKEIEEYCILNGLSYVTDSSNLVRKYSRNKIRLDVIPALKGINQSLEDTLFRNITSFSEDASYLDDTAEDSFVKLKVDTGYNAQGIRELAPAIKKRVIIRIIKGYINKYVESKHIKLVEELLDNKIYSVMLGEKLSIIVENGVLKSKNPSCIENISWEYKIKDVNVLTEAERTLIIKILSIKQYNDLAKVNDRIYRETINIESVPKGAIFRNRRPGDIFSPIGRGGTKTIKKLFNEFHIPLEQRYNLPMLAFENQIIWIEGIGVSEKYRFNGSSGKAAIILKGKGFR